MVTKKTKLITSYGMVVFSILFTLNVTLYLTAIAQVSPGVDDGEYTCYGDSDPCDSFGDCDMLILCQDTNECPDSRTEVKNGTDASTCT